MSAPSLSKFARAVVNAVITAYRGGASYNTVARDLGISSTSVRSIVHRHAPELVRTRPQQIMTRVQPKPAEEGLTLAALGLSRVGPCRGCGVEMVAQTRENPVKGQTCGLCKAFAATRAA